MNTLTGLVVIHTIQGLSFTTLFCRNYYIAIPQELIRAARIDGAGFFRIFWRIILPLSPPILVVTVIWQFTHIWNEFLYGVTFTTGQQQPVTAALIALIRRGRRYPASWRAKRRGDDRGPAHPADLSDSAASISCAALPPAP